MTTSDVIVSAKAPHVVATELRDNLLPDLLAVSMLMTTIRRRLDPTTVGESVHQLLDDLTSTLDVDVSQVRSVISELSRTAA